MANKDPKPGRRAHNPSESSKDSGKSTGQRLREALEPSNHLATVVAGLVAVASFYIAYESYQRPNARTFTIPEASAGIIATFYDAPKVIHLYVRNGAEGAPMPIPDFHCELKYEQKSALKDEPLPENCAFSLLPAHFGSAPGLYPANPIPVEMTIEDPSQVKETKRRFEVQVYGVHTPRIEEVDNVAANGTARLAVKIFGPEAGLFDQGCTWAGPVRDHASCDTTFDPSEIRNTEPKEESTKARVYVTLTKRDDKRIQLEWRSTLDLSTPPWSATLTPPRPDSTASTPIGQSDADTKPSSGPESVSKELDKKGLVTAFQARPSEPAEPREGGSMSVGEALNMLNDVSEPALRKRTMEASVFPKLAQPISASDAAALVSGFEGYDRADLLRQLKGCISRPIKPADRDALLEGVTGAARTWADNSLDAAGDCRIASNVSQHASTDKGERH